MAAKKKAAEGERRRPDHLEVAHQGGGEEVQRGERVLRRARQGGPRDHRGRRGARDRQQAQDAEGRRPLSGASSMRRARWHDAGGPVLVCGERLEVQRRRARAAVGIVRTRGAVVAARGRAKRGSDEPATSTRSRVPAASRARRGAELDLERGRAWLRARDALASQRAAPSGSTRDELGARVLDVRRRGGVQREPHAARDLERSRRAARS